MKLFVRLLAALGYVVCTMWFVPAIVGQEKLSDDEQALRKRAADFIEAFNKGDAVAVAAFWTPDGDYVDQAGHALRGRKAIESAFRKQFANAPGAKLRVHPTAFRLVKPDLAIEDGITEVFLAGGGLPAVTRYTSVHIKQDGQWYLASVRDSVALPPSHYEHLHALEWLVGHWADETTKGDVARVSYGWAEGRHFLLGRLTTTVKDVPVAGATQWIGWDPTAKQIRSWSFDSSGGFSEAIWTEDNNRWLIKSVHTLRDGKKHVATNIVTKVDADHLTWQATKVSVDGKSLPDSEIVKMKRVR